jgi:hypothetical protein
VTPPAAAAAARSVAPQRTVTPRRPQRPLRSAPPARRVSGPARSRRERGAAAPGHEGGLALALPAALRSLSTHRLLDRLIAGKAWIVVVAFALIGIVTLQLALLQLNSGIGRALERGSVLQRQNAALSIENSEMVAGDRVETRATHLGMEIVAPGALHFLSARSGADVAHAAAALAKPASTTASTAPAASAASSEASAASASSSSSSSSSSSGEAESRAAPVTPSSGEGSAAPSGEASGAAAEAPATSPPTPAGSPGSPEPASSAPSAGTGEAAAGGGTQPGPTG